MLSEASMNLHFKFNVLCLGVARGSSSCTSCFALHVAMVHVDDVACCFNCVVFEVVAGNVNNLGWVLELD